jgi:formylglycine-generating enzyme required for sulfatase activity
MLRDPFQDSGNSTLNQKHLISGPDRIYTLYVNIRVAAGIVAVSLAVALFATRLVAPGPADFYIEPGTGMVLIAIRPGSFMMGSPESEPGRNDDEVLHRVMVPRLFYIGQHEVTQAEWMKVMGSNPSHFSDCERCPIEQVDFYQVNNFLSRLNAGTAAMRFRLPTEAEWEYACRAGTSTAYNTGARITTAQANIDSRFVIDAEGGAAYDKTLPVGKFPPNAWGLYDMHGNVWEWTNDRYGPYNPKLDTDPRGAEIGGTRVIRGGSWHFDANSARCGLRYTHAPQDSGFSVGFRVVGEPTPPRRRR